jgi:spore germination protein GerM
MREVKKINTVKSGSGASKTSTYIHFNKHTDNNFNVDNASVSTEVTEVEISSAFKSLKSSPRKRQKISYTGERFKNRV